MTEVAIMRRIIVKMLLSHAVKPRIFKEATELHADARGICAEAATMQTDMCRMDVEGAALRASRRGICVEAIAWEAGDGQKKAGPKAGSMLKATQNYSQKVKPMFVA